jgi:hypothetical protein
MNNFKKNIFTLVLEKCWTQKLKWSLECWSGGMAQVDKHLSSKHNETLSSKPNYHQKKKKRQNTVKCYKMLLILQWTNIITFSFLHYSCLHCTDLKSSIILYLLFFVCVCDSGVWTQGLILARQVPYHLNHSVRPLLCWVFSKTGSCELFARAGFEPISSWIARVTGVSHWRPSVPSVSW